MKNSYDEPYLVYQKEMSCTTKEIDYALTLYTANIDLFFYESSEAIIQSVYNLDEIIGVDGLIIDEDNGWVISPLGLVSLFAGTIIMFSH